MFIQKKTKDLKIVVLNKEKKNQYFEKIDFLGNN